MARRRGRSKNRLILGAAIAVVALAGLALGVIDLDGLTGGDGGPAASVPGTSDAGSPSEASEAPAQLEVAPAGSMEGYSREDFPHWSGAGEFGW